MLRRLDLCSPDSRQNGFRFPFPSRRRRRRPRKHEMRTKLNLGPPTSRHAKAAAMSDKITFESLLDDVGLDQNLGGRRKEIMWMKD